MMRLKIRQVLNTDAVLAVEDDKEYIVMGKNIGFRKKVGQVVEERLIEKRFLKTSEGINALFEE